MMLQYKTSRIKTPNLLSRPLKLSETNRESKLRDLEDNIRIKVHMRT